MRYRHFRNADPPALADVWNDALVRRGAVELRSPSPLDDAVFNKPYFDPAGLIVAEDDGRIVGFAHGGFGPTEDQSALDRTVGVVAAVVVRPEARRRKMGTELLRRCEDYLQASGARSLLAGGQRPIKPFYTGVYGGSNAPGFLLSDAEADPFFRANGYSAQARTFVFDRRIDAPLTIVDPRFTPLRRKYEPLAVPQARLGTWWRECVLGPLEPSEFRLDDRQTGQTAAKALFWEMKDFGWRWGAPAAGIVDVQVRDTLRRQGLGKFLVAQLLRHLQEQYFAIAEVQVLEADETASQMFRSLGFVQVDIGVTYAKPASTPAAE